MSGKERISKQDKNGYSWQFIIYCTKGSVLNGKY